MTALRPNAALFTRAFVLVFFANLFQGIAFSLFLHLPGFLKDLGADETEIGLIFGITALVSIAVRPKVGSVMDNRGRRVVILAGNFLNVAVIGGYVLVGDVGVLLYAVRILHGLAEALLFTALFTYAADQVPPARLTQGLAIFGVSGMLPISIGGLLGDVILERAGYDALFLTALALAVLALLFALQLRDAPRSEAHEEEPPRGFRAALLQSDLMPLWWIATIFSVALAAMFTFVKTFVMETGAGSVGGFFTGYTAIALVLRVFFGWLPDRIGPKRVLFPALAVLATGFVLLSQATTSAEVALAGVLCGAGHGYTFPILFGMVVSRTREADRGSAMAIYTALFDVGVLLGGPSLGFVIERAGYPAMYAVAAVLVFLGTVVFAVWDRGRS
ncbi:MAG: MFS transporter [Proteobacteria bacterium]|nr:MFS transporter [Pseudomonadota bacterium]